MIKKIEISGIHMDVGPDLKKYVTRKIGQCDRYAPRAARVSMRVDVKLKEGGSKTKANRTCEVIVHLPGETFTVSETTINIFAAIDIAEQKLKNHLRKYKEKHNSTALHRRFMARIRRK